MRVQVDQHGQARSAGTQASHALGSLAGADGLVDVPPNATLPAGTMTLVIRFDD
jgi:molybdopterin biosynthesis enzyme